MKILYITTKTFVKDLDTGCLQYFADAEDITISSSIEEAKSYMWKQLMVLQRHIDFILFDASSFGVEEADQFQLYISQSTSEYSGNNFRLSGIPLIVILKNDAANPFDDNRKALHTDILFENTRDNVKQLIIEKRLTKWLEQIGSELDYFDMDTKLDFNANRISWLIDHRGYRLNVLTETFFRRMQRLPYIWFGANLKTFDVSFNKFDNLLRKSVQNPALRNEKEIHQFLKANERVILGEFFMRSLYENQFYRLGTRKYVEPDFLNIAFPFYHHLPEVFEVKLPNQRFVRKDKQVFYRNTTRAFNQVHLKYRQYFSSLDHKEEIERRTGYCGNDFSYTLLMGRKSDKEENIHFLENYTAGKNLRLISYDELPEKFQRNYERVKRFSLN